MAEPAPAPAGNGDSRIESFKSNATAAYNTVSNGPVAQNVRKQTEKTSSEFSKLAASRQTPANPAATGQPLTHYHSFFSELLSWKNPRASAVAFSGVVAFIFAFRYLDLLRWGFRLTYLSLAATVAAEAAGKAILGQGFASQFRPKKYYTVSRETLDSFIGDVHELINFFVIESQRILFAENVYASAAACVAAFLSFYLVKIVPYWGLALIATTLLFTVPLVYTSNQELIDHHLKNASDAVSAQTEQLRGIASKHTAHGVKLTKQYMGDYTTKAQQMLRGRSAIPETATKPASPTVQEKDFPAAPQEAPAKHEEPSDSESEYEDDAAKTQEEPLIAT